jgi:D-glycero-D-manno-heptose 1,7-bisphosphate phosphatase
MNTKLVILDRDGTINVDSDEFIKSPEEWHPIEGALEAIGRLNHAGYHVVVATNQSGLGRGLMDVASLNAIHDKMNKQLSKVGGRIDAIFYCPHAPEESCQCRKPAPGLLEQIAERYGMGLEGVPFVGDSLRDLQAAQAAGCRPHLVLTGKSVGLRGQALPTEYPAQTQAHHDLDAFVSHWLRAVATSSAALSASAG